VLRPDRSTKLIFCFFLIIFSSHILAQSIVIQPGAEGKDTWVYDVDDFSHGDWGELRTNDIGSFLQYALIEFDLSSLPPGSVIVSATLGLYRYDGYNTSGLVLNSHRILDPWTEDVSWTGRPAYDPAIESTTTVSGNGWYNWDLTNVVQGWVSGAFPNHGVAIHDNGTGLFQRFVSSDNVEATQPSWALPPADPQYRPVLQIDYMQGVPTLNEWGMMAFVSLLLVSGLFFIYRGRKIHRSV